MDTRSQLGRRLAAELGDEALASSTVAGLGDDVVDRLDVLAGGDIAESPALSYAPTTVTADDVDTLWVFSYGYRLTPAAEAAGVTSDGAVPPIEALEPGPTNADLARIAAEFVAEHPVPVIAQWEVARELEALGVPDVISVGPDTAEDGTVTYLSTAGVTEKGLRLAGRGRSDPGSRRCALPRRPRRSVPDDRSGRRSDRRRPRRCRAAHGVRPPVGSGLDPLTGGMAAGGPPGPKPLRWLSVEDPANDEGPRSPARASFHRIGRAGGIRTHDLRSPRPTR